MTPTLHVAIRGIGSWAPGIPDWTTLRAVLRDEGAPRTDAPTQPNAAILPAAERRRAPPGVRLAADVATQACAMANADAATLPCIFATTHGEIAITDYVAKTLARAPLELSPTQFHNSVLNAPAGYWTIATGCTTVSSAVTAYHNSFAAGLLEATALACAEATPVLFVLADVAATGPLLEMNRTRAPFGMALVLAPAPPGPRLAVCARTGPPQASLPAPPALLVNSAASNPATAHALALLALLASHNVGKLALPLSTRLSLDLGITP